MEEGMTGHPNKMYDEPALISSSALLVISYKRDILVGTFFCNTLYIFLEHNPLCGHALSF